MRLHPKHHTFVMETLTGLPADVRKARKHMIYTLQSCSRAAKAIGVSKQMVKMVLSGRKTSARVLAGIMALPKLMTLEEYRAATGSATKTLRHEGGER